jgi:hypothetical protein
VTESNSTDATSSAASATSLQAGICPILQCRHIMSRARNGMN